MSVSTFLKLGDIKGESTVDGYADQIEVHSFSNGFQQPTSPIRSGTGPSTGMAVHSMLSFSKLLDCATPNLCKALWSATVYKEAVLTCCRMDNDKAIAFLTITMSDVIVASYNLSGGNDLPYENVSLNYASIKYAYVTQKKEGKPEGNLAASHDLKTNKVS